MTGTLRVRTLAQKVLMDEELAGQISDGYWENTRPLDHWQQWTSAEVVVDPTNVGRDFWALKDNYDLTARALLDVVGDRMVQAVNDALRAADPTAAEYTRGEMIRDLKDLKAIFRQRSMTDDQREAAIDAIKAEQHEAEAAAEAPEPYKDEIVGDYESFVEKLAEDFDIDPDAVEAVVFQHITDKLDGKVN